ncbi:MAG TPA: hypothetical protein VH143_26385 [Kofleriaceae bacterium]|jgi:hypothetical protein|nr:hypothetical protein [Kofleriaceae bacterium]
MTADECMDAILANPEDDAPRHKLATAIAASDPPRADFIERQLAMSKRMRETFYNPGVSLIGGKSGEEDALLRQHARRWSRDLGMYMGEIETYRTVEFHRGLPWLCSMNPHLFLERGDYVLTKLAPLRGIEFFPDPDGDAFPAAELAACPWLSRLDEIRFAESTLAPGDLAVLATSPHLKRVMTIDARGNPRKLAAYQALAANPLTRRCLTIVTPELAADVPSDGGPIGELTARDDQGRYGAYEMSTEGHALEREHGYIPWLHLENRGSNPADAHYWHDTKVLPVSVPGSRADAPQRYGKGLLPRESLEPRAEARYLFQ